MYRKRLLVAMFGGCIAFGLAACGSDSDSSSSSGLGGLSGGTTTTAGSSGTEGTTDTTGESGTGTTTTGSTTNAAHTIVLTYPQLNSIEDLGGGVYRRIGKAIVSDNEGNPVPDGTKVYLNLIDSVIAQGTITTADGDSITGAVLTDTNPTLGDGTTVTAFDTAYVERNEAYHFIEQGDHIFLTSLDGTVNADPEDKNRIISSEDGSITNTTLTVTQDYENDYPNSTYATGVTDYVIGVSALGGKVLGVEADGSLVNTGYSVTENGVATFYVTYPATIETIRTGCGNPSDDTRALPAGSARVYLVASAGTEATTVDDDFCFSSIASWSMAVFPTSSISGTTSLSVELEDGGDTVNLPFVYVTSGVEYTTNTGGLTVTLDDPQGLGAGRYRTDTGGWFYPTINVAGGASDDEATVTFFAGDATAEVTIKIP